MTDALDDATDILSLSGTWQFRLDPEKKGIEEAWYGLAFEDTVQLPGTTDQNFKGEKVDEQCVDRLSRVWRWIGAAWYQRRVSIPAHWAGKHITLFLERTKHSRVWIDKVAAGTEDSLGAPHVYDLSGLLTQGEHTITVLIDNSKLPPVGPAHAVDERTQTNWNGIIGRIELEARNPVWVDDVQVYPDAQGRRVDVTVRLGNMTDHQGRCELTIAVEETGPAPINAPAGKESMPVRQTRGAAAAKAAVSPVSVAVDISGPDTLCSVTCPLSDASPLWDEFSPRLLRMTVSVVAKMQSGVVGDSRSVTFGLRSFRTANSQFVINGRPTFLRGKHDACIFPLTGYPPMDKAGWLNVFGIAKSYGINHYRFHSWCPPDAAFAAADELGMYLQAELPNKAPITRPEATPYVLPANAFETGEEVDPQERKEAERTAYLRREGEKMLRTFGNHPSFVMMTLGNEIGGERPVMKSLCDHFRSLDRRHLYAQGTNHFHWEPGLQEGDEFWVTDSTAHDKPLRGSFFQGKYPGHVDNLPPSTTVDFSRSIQGVPVPVVGHETGQYQVSPDFSEIPKYTGVLRARMLEIFRERLTAAGMLDQADAFVRASGALSVICYREDIEAALRTDGLGGFQLLDLQDFPGQGTALVGILNAFMESKGLIATEKWREFCCETVPLLSMKRYTWTTADTFKGRISVAHYGPADLPGATIAWRLDDAKGKKLRSGQTAPTTLHQGRLNVIEDVAFELSGISSPQKCLLTLELSGSSYRNTYPIWIYAASVEKAPAADVYMTRTWDSRAKGLLAAAGKVLLVPQIADLKNSIKGSFQCDFWCWPMFKRTAERENIEVAPGTLGILCDPEHKALAQFPTESHSNWQWWHLVKQSRPVILDGAPADYRPIVQVIDNFARNHKLGVLFEARIGAGKLLVCTIDVLNHQDKPEMRQFLTSLLAYMKSPAFNPSKALPMETLERILYGTPSPAGSLSSDRRM